MSRPLIRTSAVAAACLVSALAGYYLADGPAAAGSGSFADSDEARHQAQASQNDAQVTSSEARRPRTPEELLALRRELMSRFSSSPWAWGDLALREQTAALLSGLDAAELKALAEDLADSVDEVKSLSRTEEFEPALMREILFQWALKDPAAACSSPTAGTMAREVFLDWQKRDPKAAEAWLASSGFSQLPQDRQDLLRDTFFTGKAATDFAAAKDLLGTLKEEDRAKILLTWSRSYGTDPTLRPQILQLLEGIQDPGQRKQSYEALVWKMGKEVPREAVEMLESLDLPEQEKTALYDNVLGAWAGEAPKEALDWWKGLGQSEIPRTMMEGIFHWSIKSPQEASAWIRELPESPARQQCEDVAMDMMTRFDQFQYAVELGRTIHDPKRRQNHLRNVFRSWNETSPDAAKNWASKLPAEDRAAVLK